MAGWSAPLSLPKRRKLTIYVDQVIILPKFTMDSYLHSIEKYVRHETFLGLLISNRRSRYRINMLYIVPPIIIQMIKSEEKCNKHDLSCVRGIFTGAAPLGGETTEALQKQYPNWKIRQGYGIEESTYPFNVPRAYVYRTDRNLHACVL